MQSDLGLDAVINATGAIAAQHRGELTDGLAVADGFVRPHLSIADKLQAADTGSLSDTALRLLSAHVFNLYTTTLELALEGRFDVAWHLSRGMFDAEGLTFAVAADEKQAEKFLADGLKASAARKFAIGYMNDNGYGDVAPLFEDRWLRNAHAANKLAHVNVRHLGMLSTMDGPTATPNYGGRQDTEACRLLFALALEEEMLFLGWIEKFRGAVLGEEWCEEALRGKAAYMAFREHPATIALLGDPQYTVWAETLEQRKRALT